MRVAHDIRLFTVTSIHRKPVEAHETARNLRQVRQKMTEEEDPRVKQERNQAGKIWGKEKVLKRRNWLTLYARESYNDCWWWTCFFRKWIYILLVSDHDEVAIAIPSINKPVLTNHSANWSYLRCSFTRRRNWLMLYARESNINPVFSRKKIVEKGRRIHHFCPTPHTSRLIVKGLLCLFKTRFIQEG